MSEAGDTRTTDAGEPRTPILSVRDLRAAYQGPEGMIPAVRGVSLDLYPGEVLALVGESAAGKSSVALATLGLLPTNAEVTGSILYEGQSLLDLKGDARRHVRGGEIAMIFQDAMAGLTPTLRVGEQIAELFLAHEKLDAKAARAAAIEALRPLLPDAERIVDAYPFQLSGGMAQRVMVAMATALHPKIVIADEPTANLDPAVRLETLNWLEEMRDNGTAVLLITHDFGVVARLADRVMVMYGGVVAEEADVFTIFRRPRHPYTYGLLSSLPGVMAGARLTPMRGNPPDLATLGEECAFLDRCPKAVTRCRVDPSPPLAVPEATPGSDVPIAPGHRVACFNPMVVDLREGR
ncbi:MAG: ABC transporter ATP-binding protein [Dehalococcoidia bacterium]|nr:MAG: ABC transporter ATP-binding protein [Dehalococcoidia bacterium]